MSTSIMYTSEDVGAPLLAWQVATKGTINEVLYQCLVSGYGDKPGLGWTLEYFDALSFTSVFKNSAADGTGMFLRVQDTPPGFTNPMFSLRCYSSMHTIDSGFNSMPPDVYSMHYRFVNASATTAPYVPWRLIGDNRGFYFLNNIYKGFSQDNNYPSQFHVFYTGDYISSIPNFKGYCLATSSKTTNGGGVYSDFAFGTNYNYESTPLGKRCMINMNPMTMEFGAIPASVTPLIPAHSFGIFNLSDYNFPLINGTAVYILPNIVSIAVYKNVGMLPGLFSPTRGPEVNGIAHEHVEKYFIFNGDLYYRVCTTNNDTSNWYTDTTTLLIHIGDKFRP